MRKAKFSHEAFGYTKHGKRWNLWLWTPGIASEFFYHFSDINQDDPTRAVVLMYRSSVGKEVQDGRHDDGLDQAILELGRYGVKLGGRLIAVFDGVERGSIYTDRTILERAVDYAKRHNAILVVGMTRDRVIRADGYDGKTNRTEAPPISEYMELMRMAGDVPIATLLHPDTQVKPVPTIRGMHREDAKPPGRPRGKFTQRQLLDAVLKLAKTLPC